jgi:hypothetical protein
VNLAQSFRSILRAVLRFQAQATSTWIGRFEHPGQARA